MEGNRTLKRRAFLGAPFLALAAKTEPAIAGGYVNDSFRLGHKLRDRVNFPAPKQTRKVPVVIVGGGIAGLSAAWRLDKKGFHDFVLLEMESEVGGNSRWGQNEISRYPWAAHYLPVPSKESKLVRELCEELGLLRAGKWDERALCFSPQERLFIHSRWQEGVEPEFAATPRDRGQYKRFQQMMKEFEGSGQFTIPMEVGAKPSALDAESMDAWMTRNQFDSAYLRWYIQYATRDDFGALLKDTSAWAAIHYFASRQPEDKGPLTWPEGNGWITEQLRRKLSRYLKTDALVYAVRGNRPVRVLTMDTEYIAEKVIFAAPTHIANYVVEGAPKSSIVYSPWFTANLTLKRMPKEDGAEPAWDNVIYDSPGLGYVNNAHMTVQSRVEQAVWTYYHALAYESPEQARRNLISLEWKDCKEAILRDLEKAHPDIRQCVSRIDVMRFGHAMGRPVPGFLGSADRQKWAKLSGNVLYANSDLSGFSIFEEAQYRGVMAADTALRKI